MVKMANDRKRRRARKQITAVWFLEEERVTEKREETEGYEKEAVLKFKGHHCCNCCSKVDKTEY